MNIEVSFLFDTIFDMSVLYVQSILILMLVNTCLRQTSKDFLGANDLIISVSDKIFQQIELCLTLSFRFEIK